MKKAVIPIVLAMICIIVIVYLVGSYGGDGGESPAATPTPGKTTIATATPEATPMANPTPTPIANPTPTPMANPTPTPAATAQPTEEPGDPSEVVRTGYTDTSGESDSVAMYGDMSYGQTFSLTESFSLTKIKVRLMKTGHPGDIRVDIYLVDEGVSPAVPTGTSLGQAIIPESAIGSSYEWETATFSTPISLDSASKYALGIGAPDGGASDYIRVSGKTQAGGGLYPGGYVIVSDDGGATWEQFAGGHSDLLFQVISGP